MHHVVAEDEVGQKAEHCRAYQKKKFGLQFQCAE
jgi:hypothetical protein